jgi:outer membrane protein assembly factor BamB
MSIRLFPLVAMIIALGAFAFSARAESDGNWPQFRGPSASGISPTAAPLEWDVATSKNIRWNVAIPGLGHSSPVVWNDRVFVTTAVAVNEGEDSQKLKIGLYGDIEPVQENIEYRWLLLCLDKATGKTIWEREAHRGLPKTKRHPKSTHANPTATTDGKRVIAFFGSEGLYCYDMDGKPLWQKDFGVLESGFFVAPDAQWGFASSPVLFEDKVVIQADVLKNSLLALLDANTGEQIWRTERHDVPTWATPTVHRDEKRTQIILNGFKEIAGYDLANGKNLWTINGGGDIPVPTPIVAGDLIFICGAHGPQAPIFAIRTSAEGDLTLPKAKTSSEQIAWSIRQGASYLPTPIALGDYLYVCRDMGQLGCYELKTGKQIYRERLDGNGFTASPVAAGDRLYFTSEDGQVHVVKAGQKFELLKTNNLGENCLATPALSGPTIIFRTQQHLIAIE